MGHNLSLRYAEEEERQIRIFICQRKRKIKWHENFMVIDSKREERERETLQLRI
jgi:lysine/ornithine N-monooxygenase